MARVVMGTSLVVFAVAVLLCGVHAQTPLNDLDIDLSQYTTGSGSGYGDDTYQDIEDDDVNEEVRNEVKFEPPPTDYTVCERYPQGKVN